MFEDNSSLSQSKSSRKGSSRSRRRRHTEKCHLAAEEANGLLGKVDALYPTLTASRPVLLEPFPSGRIVQCALVSSAIVTCHKSGLKLYRELVGDETTGSTGIWNLAESRTTTEYRDAYLTVGFSPEATPPHSDSSPYQRYFATATGSDRTIHSVCVSSVSGHFLMHHETHGSNKIVAMHFSQITVSKVQQTTVPLVVSVDELGFIAVYNVNKDCAFPIYSDVSDTIKNLVFSSRNSSEQQVARIYDEVHKRNVFEAENRFHLESGVATNLSFCGPCIGLCASCENPLSAIDPKAGYLMNIVVSLRGKEVYDATSAPDGVEIAVVHLRVLVLTRGAVLLSATPLVNEVIPFGVCEGSPAVCREAHSDVPRFCLARCGLKVEVLAGCTGEVLRTLAVDRKGEAAEDQLLVKLVPLGAQRVSSEDQPEYRCYMGLTGRGSVLLLGTTATSELAGKVKEEEYSAKEQSALNDWLDDVDHSNGSDSPMHVGRNSSEEGSLSVLMCLFSSPNTNRDGQTVSSVLNTFVSHDYRWLLILLKGDVFLRVELPFWSPPAEKKEIVQEVPSENAGHAIWEATKRMTQWSPSPSRWSNYFKQGGSADPPVAKSASPSSPRYDINLAKPILSALFSFTESSPPRNDTQPVLSGGDSPAPEAPPSTTSASGTSASPRASPVPPLESLAPLLVEVDWNIQQQQDKKEKAPSPPHLTDLLEGCPFEDISTLVSDIVKENTPQKDVSTTNAMTEIYLFSQVTETSARNLILAHEQEVLLHIYLNFFDKQSQIDDEEKKRQHCAETLRLHRGTLFLPVLKNVLKGKRTDHFLKSVLDTVYLQKAARNKRGVFDFDSYFQTREVPSHLLDLQERDRCFYELNDLQIRQEAETRTLPEFYGDVVIYQNEEAVPPHTAKRKNWQAHRTFPYDSEEGDTVDISFLNRSADFTKDGAFCWVDEEESPLLYTSPASKRTTVLAKELRQWSVGTWLYASRWPFREERHSFRWSDAEDSSSVVRCRKLTRRRMDLRAKELREAMERKHQREVEQLRLDLNL